VTTLVVWWRQCFELHWREVVLASVETSYPLHVPGHGKITQKQLSFTRCNKTSQQKHRNKFVKCKYFQNITRKAQLTQREMRDSSACLKARCEQNVSSQTFDISWWQWRFIYTHQRAWPVSLSHIGLKSQIFPIYLSFSSLAQGDLFRIYGKVLRIVKLESSKQPNVKIS